MRCFGNRRSSREPSRVRGVALATFITIDKRCSSSSYCHGSRQRRFVREENLKMILSSNVSGSLSWRGAVAIFAALIGLTTVKLARLTVLHRKRESSGRRINSSRHHGPILGFQSPFHWQTQQNLSESDWSINGGNIQVPRCSRFCVQPFLLRAVFFLMLMVASSAHVD